MDFDLCIHHINNVNINTKYFQSRSRKVQCQECDVEWHFLCMKDGTGGGRDFTCSTCSARSAPASPPSAPASPPPAPSSPPLPPTSDRSAIQDSLEPAPSPSDAASAPTSLPMEPSKRSFKSAYAQFDKRFEALGNFNCVCIYNTDISIVYI